MDFEDAFFDTKDYEQTKKLLGQGAFGKVWVVNSINDDTQYAAKIINTNGAISGREQMILLRESIILHKLHHIAIVKFKGINFHSFEDPSKLEPTILTEYLPHGSLKEILDKEKKSIADDNWNPTKKYICILGISDAMRYLHKNGIIHRDLKPENILIDENYYPRVCDFGLSRCFSDSLTKSMQMSMTGQVGTPLYMAPELLEDNEHYSSSVDVYAFAILAYEIVTGKEPFSEHGKKVSIRGLMTKVMAGNRPEFTDGVTDKMVDLISKCWSQDPNERPSFEEIFEQLSSDFSYFDESVDSDEIEDYLMDLKDTCEENQIQTKMSETQKQCESYQKINKELEEKLKNLQEELIESQKQCESYKEVNKKLEKEVKNQQKNLHSMYRECELFHEGNKELEDQVKSLQEKLDLKKIDQLIIKVVKATDLLKPKSSKKCNPCVKLNCGSLSFSTKVIKDAFYPSWNETFVFDIIKNNIDIDNDYLIINMYSIDIWKRKEKLANEIKLGPLSKFMRVNEHIQILDLKLNNNQAGTLRLEIQLVNRHNNQDDYDYDKDDDDKDNDDDDKDDDDKDDDDKDKDNDNIYNSDNFSLNDNDNIYNSDNFSFNDSDGDDNDNNNQDNDNEQNNQNDDNDKNNQNDDSDDSDFDDDSNDEKYIF